MIALRSAARRTNQRTEPAFVEADLSTSAVGGRWLYTIRRVWNSRVIMTAFYLLTLAGLVLVAGGGPEEDPLGPITQAARAQQSSVSTG